MKPPIRLFTVAIIALFDLVRVGFYFAVWFLEVVSATLQILPANRKRLQRVLSTAVILTLMLQLLPLSLSAPSKSVATLLSQAPPPFRQAAPYLQEVIAPLDPFVSRLSESFVSPVYAAGAEITKTVQSQVAHGATLAYTLTVANTSGSDWGSSTAYITDTIPDNTGGSISTWTDDFPWAASTQSQTVKYINAWGTITNGTESAVGGFYVTVDKPLMDGTIITNSNYVITTTAGDIDVGTPVTTEVLAPAFTLDQTAVYTICAGSSLTYTMFVSNTGRLTMKGPFTVTAAVDNAVTINPGSLSADAVSSGNAITWTIDLTLTNGTGVTRTFQVTVPDSVAHRTILTNVYTATNPSEVQPDGFGAFGGVSVDRAEASFSTNAPVAYGTPVSFTNTSMAGFLGDGEYLWEYGDGATSNDDNVTHTHLYADPLISIYFVTLTVTSTYGCGVISTTQPVTVLLVSTVTLTANPTNTAANGTSPITLTAVVSDPTDSPAAGTVLTFTTSLGNFTNGLQTITATTDASGVATTTITSTVAGRAIVTATAVSLVSDTVVITFGNVLNLNTGIWFAAIQDAVDDSNTTDGHTLLAYNSIYTENVTINKAVTLTGESRTGTIVRSAGTNCYDISADSGQTVIEVQANGVRINTLTVDGTIDNTCSPPATYALAKRAIYGGANNVVVTNTTVMNSVSGIAADSASGWMVDDNTAQNCGIDGDADLGGGIVFSNTTGSTIGTNVPNVITHSLAGTANYPNPIGIHLRQSSVGTVANNAITDAGEGIRIDDSQAVVLNNSLSGNENVGIQLDNNTVISSTVFSNTINSGGDGIYVWAMGVVSGYISYNTIDDAGGDGMVIDGTPAVGSIVSVTENVVRNSSGDGLRYSGVVTDHTVGGNIFCGNSGFTINNTTGSLLTAEGNWWGHNSPIVAGTDYNANVDWDPPIELTLRSTRWSIYANGVNTMTLIARMQGGGYIPYALNGMVITYSSPVSVPIAAPPGPPHTAILTDGLFTPYLVVTSTDVPYDGWVTATYQICDGGVFSGQVRFRWYDLQLDKTGAPSELLPGERITFTIDYYNSNEFTATAVLITDVLPLTMTGVYSTSSGPVVTLTTNSHPTYAWEVGDLGMDTGGTITIAATVSDTCAWAPSQWVVNRAWITGSLKDIVSGNNYDQYGFWVRRPDLSVSKEVTPTDVTPGDWVTYTIVYSNGGGASVPDVLITETVPAELTNVSYFTSEVDLNDTSPPSYTWEVVGTLDGTGYITITGQVSPNIVAQGLGVTNWVSVSTSASECVDIDNYASATFIIHMPDVGIDKSIEPVPPYVLPGETVTYTIVFSNNGPVAAQDVRITETIPTELINVDYITSGVDISETGAISYVWQVVNPLISGTVGYITITAQVSPDLVTQDLAVTNWVSISTAMLEYTTTNNYDSETFYVRTSDVSIDKSVAPTVTVPGQNVTYTIVYSNVGLIPAADVVITETIPAELTNVDYFTSGVDISETGSISYVWQVVNPLISGTVGYITITAQVSPNLTSLVTVTNWVSIGTSIKEYTTTNNYDSAQFIVLGTADVSIAKTARPVDPVLPGDWITYTLVFSNSGPAAATNVVITETIPNGLINVTYFTSGVDINETGSLPYVWQVVGPLLSGTVGYITIEAQIDPGFSWPAESTLFNTATITTTLLDTQSINNSDSATITVRTTNLFITKTVVSADTVPPGALVTYTLSYLNTGPADTRGTVSITDAIPVSLTLLMSQTSQPLYFDFTTPNVYRWYTDSLPAGQGGVVTITAQVTSTIWTISARIANTGWLSGFPASDSSQLSSTAYITVVAADVAIFKSMEPPVGPVQSGDVITYTLLYTNQGMTPAANVWVTDYLPSGVTPSGVVSWDLGTLNPAATDSRQITVTVDVTDAYWAVYTNTAIITTTSPEYRTDNNQSTTVITLAQEADVVITKTAIPATPPVTALFPGDPLTYVLEFANQGQARATGVTVTDSVPSGLNVSGVISQGAAITETSGFPNYSWDVQDLVSGAGGVITINAQIDTATSWGQDNFRTNRARIATTAIENVTTNNYSETTTRIWPGPPYTVTVVAVPVDTTSVDSSLTISATVTDQYGNLVRPTTVTFTWDYITPPWPNMVPTAMNTNLGVATSVISSEIPGSAWVTGTAYSSILSAYISDTVQVTFTSGTVHHFVMSPITDPQTAGVAFGVVITAEDRYDNLVSTFNGNIALQDNTATLQPTAISFSGGITNYNAVITHAQTNVYIRPISGSINIYDSNLFTVVHGLTDTLEIGPQNATVAAGGTVVYTVTARDEFGNPWDATSMVNYAASGGGTFGPQPGGNTFNATMPIGTHIVTATDPVSTTLWVTTTVNVTRGLATSMTIFPRGITLIAGDTQVYTAVVTDSFGNDWMAGVGEVNFSVGGGNVFLAPGNILSATRAGTWPVDGAHATVPAVTDATTVTIVPSVTVRFIGSLVGPATAGVAFPVIFTATDAFGNPTPSFSGYTATMTDSTKTIIPTLTGPFSPAGDWLGTVTITKAQTGDYITVTGFLTPSIQGVIGPFTVLAGPAATVTVDVNPIVIPTCVSATITATVRDAYDNLVSSAPVNFTYVGVPSAATIAPASGSTAANGQLTAALSSTQSGGPGQVRAQTGAIVATSQAVTFTLSGYSITLQSSAATIRLDETAIVTATVRDCGGNPLAGQVVTFTASQGNVGPITGTSDASGLVTTIFSPTITGPAIITGSIDTAYDTIQIDVQPSSYDMNIPLILLNYPLPDLVVQSIEFSPSPLVPGAPYNVIVTIANEGVSTVVEDFWVDLYLNPATPPVVNQIWPDLCPGGSWDPDEGCYGKAWYVTLDIPPGGSVTLNTSDPEVGRFSDWPPPVYSATHSPFYVLVDSWGFDYGEVREANEDNNLASRSATGTTMIVTGSSRAAGGGGPRPEKD